MQSITRLGRSADRRFPWKTHKILNPALVLWTPMPYMPFLLGSIRPSLLSVVELNQQRGEDIRHCGDVAIRLKGTAKARSPGVTGDP